MEIPDGLKGSVSAQSEPQHGFRIGRLGATTSMFWADGSYNSADAHSAGEVLDEALKNISADAKVESVSRSEAHLGTLPAASISIRYRPFNSQSIMMRDQIVALRPEEPPGIIYTVGMIVSADRYPSQRAIFLRLVHSFHREKMLP